MSEVWGTEGKSIVICLCNSNIILVKFGVPKVVQRVYFIVLLGMVVVVEV
jgi:hypothetical protein